MKKPIVDKRMMIVIVIVSGFLASVAGNLPALLEMKYADIHDWQQFNALSLITRSCLLYYRTLPMFDPWICGGTDILANPQNRVFSPMILLDILFPPQLANIMSFIIYGTIGFAGCFYLFRHFKISILISMTCATMFVNAQWFGLHFAEGHIPYGSFLLIPWVLLCYLNIRERKYMFILFSIFTVFLLDGGFYPFIFSIVMFGICLILGLVPLKDVFNKQFFLSNWLFGTLILLFFALTVSVKLIPLMTHSLSQPAFDNLDLKLEEFPFLFGNPMGSPLDVVQSIGWYYHEYGCYIGIVMLALVLIYLFSREHIVKSYKFLLVALFFFWIGTGWGGLFNPYALLQRIPLVNIAHVQSRYLLIMYLFLLIILGFALQQLRERKIVWYLFAFFLVVESFFVRIYPMYKVYELGKIDNRTPMTESILKVKTLAYTVENGDKPFHYFKGLGSKYSYEPMGPGIIVRSNENGDYRGEIYFQDENIKGRVFHQEVTPGKVVFNYSVDDDSQLPAVIELNMNHLAGWKVASGKAKIIEPNQNDFIKVQVSERTGTIVIQYAPWYLGVSLPLYIVGVLLWIYLFLTLALKNVKLFPEKEFIGIPVEDQSPVL